MTNKCGNPKCACGTTLGDLLVKRYGHYDDALLEEGLKIEEICFKNLGGEGIRFRSKMSVSESNSLMDALNPFKHST